jgi:dynein light chain LC8-type
LLSVQYLAEFPDFEKDGLQVAELIKKHLDTTWSPSWHVIIGKNFGSLCTHETKRFLYFYTGDKAVMIFKAGGAP